MTRFIFGVSLIALLSACGNSSPPSPSASTSAAVSSPIDATPPASDPAPAPTPAAAPPPAAATTPVPVPTVPAADPAPQATAFNPFEGVWLTQSGQVLASYLIIDANGNYWFEIPLASCSAMEEAGAFGSNGTTITGPDAAVPWNDSLNCSTMASQIGVSAALSDRTVTLDTTWMQSSFTPPSPPVSQAALTTWTLSPLTSMTPSLASVTGNWTLPDGSIMTIAQDGTLTLNNHDVENVTTCQISGTVSIADPATNVYTVTANALDGCLGIYPDGWSVMGVFTDDGMRLHGGLTVGPAALISLDTI